MMVVMAFDSEMRLDELRCDEISPSRFTKTRLIVVRMHSPILELRDSRVSQNCNGRARFKDFQRSQHPQFRLSNIFDGDVSSSG